MPKSLRDTWRRRVAELGKSELGLDTAFAIVVFAVGVLLLSSRGLGDPEPGVREIDVLGVALLALIAAGLAVRRVAPAAALVWTVSLVALLGALSYPPELSNIALIPLYTLATKSRGERRDLLLGLAGFGAVVASWLVSDAVDGFEGPEVLTEALLWLAVWFAGDRVRLRRERMAELEERALRAERETERERRLAAAEERATIARELHDSAGHAMNVILVEAGAARLLRERDPDRARASIETIENVARSTISEIDRLVRALREDGESAGPASSSPLPGLDDIDALIERHRETGLSVSATVDGDRRAVPPGVGRAAYRIVQEALLNAARHGDDRADLRMTFAPAALEIEVTNPVARNGAGREGGGHGIVGMRERASLLGGSLEAGRSGRTFHVRAVLPFQEDAR